MDLSTIDPQSSSLVCSLCTGKPILQVVSEWRFQPGITPFSQWPWPVGAAIFYFVVLHTIQRLMVSRKPLEIPTFLFLHNITLCIASFFLGSWLVYILGAEFFGGLTTHQLICSKQIYENGHLQLIYYINMFFKVWEFIDTFLLALRKKPIAFLHSYHHAATLILTWNQLMEYSAPQWVPIVLNLWVHVVMYYYYAMSALRIRVWWKKYLTTLQICQFIVDVTVIAYAYATFIAAGFDPNVCYGNSRGAIVGLIILSSYLLLFIRFYLQTYSKKSTSTHNSRDNEAKKEQTAICTCFEVLLLATLAPIDFVILRVLYLLHIQDSNPDKP